MEKKRPTYDLNSIKAAFAEPGDLQITKTASRSAKELGFGKIEIVEVIQSIHKNDFIKSMTSHADYAIWQDVYNVSWKDMFLYVKFTEGAITGFLLLSFKEV